MRRIIPKHAKVNIVGHKYIWFAISAVIVVVATIAMFTRGLNFGVEFKGGTEIDIQCKTGTTISQIRDVVGKYGYPDAQIQSSGKSSFIIRTPKLDEAKRAEIINSLKQDAGMESLLSMDDIGPGWGGQVTKQAIIALIVFIFAVLVYISFRFEFKMAICAIIEIVHDFIITIGVYALVGREVTPATVIAVLTILGYSLYDAIVIFDRIKENADKLTRQSRKTYSEMVNESIQQVLARSINTSLTTLIPIVSILLFGGVTLQAFAFALFIGVLSGTYSSIILAPPILATWKESEPKYRAYRERVERKEARETRAPLKVVREKPAPGAAADAASKDRKATKASQKKAEPTLKPVVKPVPKEVTVQKKTTKAQVSGKSSAKSRTKGPGSKKKKKKR